MNKMIFLLVGISVFLASYAREERLLSLREFKSGETGFKTSGVKLVDVETPKGKFKVWTKRFENNPRMNVLLLHGGPGSTHEYWKRVESFLPQEGTEFIYYDQPDSWYSDQLDESSLWVMKRFVEEVEQVRKAPGLNKNNFYLLGHSWSGILVMGYSLKYQGNLKALMISNMMSRDIQPDVLKQIREFEAKGDYKNSSIQTCFLNITTLNMCLEYQLKNGQTLV
jgi:proline iminopeptidase